MTNSDTSEQSEWVDCRGGEISGLVRRLKSQRTTEKRRQIVRSVSVAAALLLMVGIGWTMLSGAPSQIKKGQGGIACSEVVKNGKQYVLHELDPELASRINAHLGKCKNCQRKLAVLRQRLGLNSAALQPKPADQPVVSTAATITFRFN